MIERPSLPVEQFNALVALFDQATHGLYDQASVQDIHRLMVDLPIELETAAPTFARLATDLGYAFPG